MIVLAMTYANTVRNCKTNQNLEEKNRDKKIIA